ncbi:MAG: alpha/beta hydrolase [Clostridia bacterium]|nr:alpha/beta hydrolase [Clostridia bacterium]
MIFYASRREPKKKDPTPTPPGAEYDPHREQMRAWIREVREIPHTDVSIRSHDGLALWGSYYEYKKGAPIEIMFHGYRGSAIRDMSGGVIRCFALERNALVVDQRAAGRSGGHVITFGARESLDCRAWVDFVIQNIDPDAKIILTGISMGAATVMMAGSMEMPPNVVGVLADCGYTSTRAIIKKVIRDMKLPPDLLYPFARLGAILFGHFDPDRDSPVASMGRCHLPVIFFHGDADTFVPCSMSEENYNACTSESKQLVVIPGAAHGICFPVDQKGYLEALDAFFKPHL